MFGEKNHVIEMFDWKFQKGIIVDKSNELPFELKNRNLKQKWKNNNSLLCCMNYNSESC